MKATKKGNMKTDVPTSTWEFFSLCRDVLGTGVFWRIFGVEKSQVSRWSVNPGAAGDTQRNPLDRIMDLFRRMVEAGEVEACRAQVGEFAQLVGLELSTPEESCRAEGKPLADEIMDIHPAIVEHAQAIRRGDSSQAVEAWEREAIRQIKQATNAYRAGCVCRGNI